MFLSRCPHFLFLEQLPLLIYLLMFQLPTVFFGFSKYLNPLVVGMIYMIYTIYIYITLTFMYILLYLICLYWSLVRIILIKHPVFPTPTSARRIALTPSLVTCRGNLWTSPIFCVQVLTFVKIRSILSIVMNHNQLKDTQDYCCSYRLLSISIQQS